MAGNLIELKDAARMLGMSPDDLKKRLSKGDIHGYRDGANWKFKSDELDRFADEEGIDLNASAMADSGVVADESDLELLSEPEADTGESSVLISDQELGDGGSSTGSTIIGKESTGDDDAADSDIQISTDDADAGGDDEEADVLTLGSDVLATGSDVLGADEATILGSGAEKGPSDTAGGSALELGEDSAVSLDQGDLELGGESDIEGDSAIDLTEHDEDLVLDSGSGSDVTLDPGDSGIQLMSPSDSGLSLEDEPLDLGGGSAVESLELGEDDEIMLEEEPADPDAATQLKADDDFLLTPIEDDSLDESDSGSQVIALDTEEFGEGEDLVGGGLEGALEPDDEALPADASSPSMAGPALAAATQPAPVEAPYSIWNVLGLFLAVALLGVGLIMSYEVLRHMWYLEQGDSFNDTLANYVLTLFGKKS